MAAPNHKGTVTVLNRDVMTVILSFVPHTDIRAASLTCRWWSGLLKLPRVTEAVARGSPDFDAELWAALTRTASLWVDLKRMARHSAARSRSHLIKAIMYYGNNVAPVKVRILAAMVQIEISFIGKTTVRTVALGDDSRRDEELTSIVNDLTLARYPVIIIDCLSCCKKHAPVELRVELGFFDPETLHGPTRRFCQRRCDYDYGKGCHVLLCDFAYMLR